MTRQGTRAEQDELTRLAIFEAFSDASHDALFSQDTVGRLVIWNRSAERIFGYHAADLVDVPVLHLFPEHVRDEVRALIDTVVGGDRVDHVETEIERKNGMLVPVALSLSPVREGGGASFGFVVVARDLTEQRLTQSALAEAETRLRDAEAFAHAGRWLWDIASDTVQWSEEMHRIHGLEPVSFDGTMTSHLAVVHPDDVERLRAALAAATAAGRPLDVEYRIRRGDGAERWLHARAEPTFGSLAVVVGLSGFARDITDRGDRAGAR